MAEKNRDAFYSIDGKEVKSIKVNGFMTVADFIDEVRETENNDDLNCAYCNGRKLEEGDLLENYFRDAKTDVIYVSDDPEIKVEDLPTFDFVNKKEKVKEIEDTISSSSHNSLNENDITLKYGKNNFRIFTTATVKSFLEGDRIVLNTKDNYEQVSGKIITLIKNFHVPEIPDDFEVHIFLPGGIPFLPGDDPTERKLEDYYLASDAYWNRLYVVVTKKLGDFVNEKVPEPCNCTKKYKNMLSPLFRTSDAGLTQIASLLGYFYHGGIHGEHIMLVLSKITQFAPLFLNIFRLLENSQPTVCNIISITAPLFILFKSLLPEGVENENVFEYTFQILTYITKIQVDQFPRIATIDLDQPPNDEDEGLKELHEYLVQTGQQNHCIFWGGDIEKEEFKGIVLEKPPKDIFTDEDNSIFKIIKVFKPVAPLSLHYIHNPTFIRGEDEKEVLLFIREITDKKNWIEYIDPKNGKIGNISIDDLATNLHNMDAEDLLTMIDGNIVDQIIIICFDESISMKFRLEGGNPTGDQLSRIKVANKFLQAFVDQSNTLRVSSLYGLIGFNSNIDVIQDLTAMSSQFLDKLKNVKASGKTLLYDALKEAQEIIVKTTKPTKPDDSDELIYPFPNAKRRIIVITDGSDNKSEQSPCELANNLIKNEIIVDTVLVGINEKNHEMCAISKLTGGLCFQPENVDEGLKIFEQEAFLNIKMRHISIPYKDEIKPNILRTEANNFANGVNKPDTSAPNKVVFLAKSNIALATPLYMNYLYHEEKEIQTIRSARALKELNIIGHHPNDNYVVYSSYSTPEEWRIFIKGPKGTPFAGKWLNCFMYLSSKYPSSPPLFKFLTIPFHPNVSQEGTIMFKLIDKEYTPMVGIDSIIEGIIDLLKNPDEDFVVNKEAEDLYNHDNAEYVRRQKAASTGAAKYDNYITGVRIFKDIPANAFIPKDDRNDDILMTHRLIDGKVIYSPDEYEE